MDVRKNDDVEIEEMHAKNPDANAAQKPGHFFLRIETGESEME